MDDYSLKFQEDPDYDEDLDDWEERDYGDDDEDDD